MRRFLTPSAVAAAGLALLLSACSGESPTAPGTVPTPAPAACNVTITLPPGPINTFGNTAVVIRATVTKNGQPVPDGTSITFTTDFGSFLETGLPTVSKTTSGGVADVTPGSVASGTANVRASFECASATVKINYLQVPDSGPFISLIDPNKGSAKGGETVLLVGGRLGSDRANTRVTFGGVPATVQAVTDTQITVLTPSRTLANPLIPEVVDVVVTIGTGAGATTITKAKAYTYVAIDPSTRIFISSVSPTSGSAGGGEQVLVLGGNFGTSVATTRVTFCGLPATITQQADAQITVSTPMKTLANPAVSETCDVAVTTDLGLVSQQSAVLPNAFTFTPVVYQPVINSISPRVGPNDAATRVTIFGTGFQFPLQVFMTGGNCGAQRIEGTITDPIALTQVVFKTPPATGAYSCLSNSIVDVEVLNPSTGKKASCAECFRYYGCPVATGVSPSLIPQDQTTLVTVSGNNFEEPVEATYQPGTGGAVRVNVTSVSSNSVVIQMPPLNQILQSGGGLTTCSNVIGTLTLKSTTLICDPVTTILTYRVDPPSIRSASPTSLNQDGSAFGTAIGSGSAVITVLGTNFVDPMTVEITKGGATIATVNNATVSNSGQLTFPAPAVPDGQMNRQDCLSGGTISGSKLVPTSFGIRVRSQRTGCSADLPAILVYNPINPNCTAGLTVTTATLPQATLCTAYAATVAAGGGTPPYVFSQTGLPAGFTLNPSTGAIASSAPQLTTTGAGGTQTVSVTISVQDAVGASTSRTYPLVINDPNGPFAVLGSATGSLPGGVTPGTVGPYTTSPATTPAGFSPVTWTVLSINPSPGGFSLNDPTSPASSIFMTPQTGNTSSISFPGGVTGGTTYTVVIRAFDAPSCGGPTHQSDFTVTVTKP